MSALAKRIDETATEASGQQELTDGFHLVIDALKLNGVKTIYNVPGIPITDLGRMMQAEGIRVHLVPARAERRLCGLDCRVPDQKPGICLTVSAPGFLNGLTALAHATTNCFPMILISGSSEREVVDLQQGDYEEMDQLAVAKTMCKAAFRVLHAADIGIGVARAIRAAVSGRPGGVYLDLPAKLFGQVMDASAGEKSLVKVIDPAPAQIPAPEAVKRALDVLKSAKKPLIILGKGAAYAQADEQIRTLVEKSGHSVPADEHGQGPSARHASAMRRCGTLDRAERIRRRHADRRAAELAAVARQGQELGRARFKEAHPDRHRAEGNGLECRDRRAAGRRHRLLRVRAHRRNGQQVERRAGRVDGAVTKKRDENVAKMAPRLMNNNSPMDYHGALGVLRTIIKERPDAILVNEGANTLDLARGVIDMYRPRKRIDVGTWGIMGIGMGYSIAAAIETGNPVLAVEGDSAFGFSGMEIETICRYNLPVCVVVFNNDGIYRGTDSNSAGSDPATTVFVKGARYDRMIEAFGGVGVNATSPDELRRAVNEAMDSGKPTLINAVIDPAAGSESGRIGNLNPQSAIRKKPTQ